MLVPCGHVKSTGWPWGKTGQPTTPVRAGVVRMGQGLGLFLTSNLRCRRSAELGPLSGADPTRPGQERGKLKKDLGTTGWLGPTAALHQPAGPAGQRPCT